MILFFLWLFNLLFSTYSYELTFTPKLQNQPVQLGKTYVVDGDTVVIDVLRFYISNPEGDYGKVLFTTSTKHYLFDLQKDERQKVVLQSDKPVNHLGFYFGVDSATNAAGALSGDLDPVHGMYWTWQSGYINIKIEGKRGRHKFQYHLGGFRKPYNMERYVVLNTYARSNIRIELPLDHFFATNAALQVNEVMSPCANAMKLTDELVASIRIAP